MDIGILVKQLLKKVCLKSKTPNLQWSLITHGAKSISKTAALTTIKSFICRTLVQSEDVFSIQESLVVVFIRVLVPTVS